MLDAVHISVLLLAEEINEICLSSRAGGVGGEEKEDGVHRFLHC
jgi:hypothetical protein